MFPTLNFGLFGLSTYTVILDLGLLAALAWLWVRAPDRGREPIRWLDAGLSAIAGGIIGGRFAFAFANWAYFQNHFLEIFRLWEGGYAWIGAVIGGVIGLFIFCRITKEPLLSLLDELSLTAPLLSALGWLGCVAANCAAGQAVPPGTLPFAVNWPDLYGVVLPRWPTQLIGLGLSLIAGGYLVSQRSAQWPKGFRFAFAIMLMALITFLVSTVRGDDMPVWSGWRLDSIANAVMVLLSLIALGAMWALVPAKQTKLRASENTEITETSK